MVLEKLFPIKDLLKTKGLLLLYAGIIAVISALTAYFLFPASASLLTIAFITIAFTHFIRRTFGMTEKMMNSKEEGLFRRYSTIVIAYAKIFIALTIVFTVLFALSPEPFRDAIFSEQINVVQEVGHIRDQILSSVGNFVLPLAEGVKSTIFLIFFNNLQVLLTTIILSFVYGAGAIFLIAYQSSILGSIIGANIVNLFSKYTSLGIYGNLFAFLHGSYMSLSIIPHGVLELLAYFLGAVAGGIISALLIGHYSHSKGAVIRTIKDVAKLILLSVALLALGAVVEAFLLFA